MKRNIVTGILLVAAFCSTANAQVAIGKNNVTNASVSLEFGSGNRGLILPWVDSESAVNDAQDGTLIFDADAKILKSREGGVWKSYTNAGTVDTTLQQNLVENTDARVSIGTVPEGSTEASGILVLEDQNKAMILPKVESPHLNISNPEPGTIVFDTKKQQVAMYNGKEWIFWN